MKTIPLSQGKVALVSDEDFERLSAFKWTAHRGSASGGRWYAVRNATEGKRRRVWVRMHRFIMDRPPGTVDGMVVDHLDNDGLNNQRENLEVVTVAENTRRIYARKREEPFL